MLRSVIGVAAAVFMTTVAHGQQLQSAPEVQPGLLQLDETQAPARNAGRQMYIVKLEGDPAVIYDGGEPGFAATKPRKGGRYNAKAGHVQHYTSHLKQKHDEKLASIGASGRKVYSYTHTMNGFAAMLTSAEAEKLKGDKTVLNVFEDYAMELDTNNSPTFLGLTDEREGLHDRLQLKGEDVIVGILDTGAIQEHPSFADTELINLPDFCENPKRGKQQAQCDALAAKKTEVVYGPPPAHWNGICQAGEAWSENDCNNKLIGARWYVDGFIAGSGSVVEGEFLSPRDSSGHGSHTASTAAGNPVTATLNGTPVTEISGMAPRARLAVYKVCWLAPGATNFSCFFSDSAAATDAAVEDGVDVLNFSVGTAAAFNDPQDIAFLFAADAGVFVARSAGNSGPDFGSTPAGEPWVTTVGASTLSGTGFALAAKVNSPASVAGDYTALEGAITGSLADLGPITDDLVAADPIDACVPLTNDIGGKIALIARGACTFTAKIENAVAAGAAAVLMYTDDRPKTVMGGTTTPATSSIPGVMIDNAPGLAILAELDAGNAVNATLSAGIFTTEELEGNIMADFSSRGPYLTETDWLKPDITAPGVRILAAYSPDQSDGSAGDVFAYLQGTSMSSPHIAGLGALVKQAHPNWSAAQIKSALMTTARQDVVKEDGSTAADPFDFGAGHVDPNGAVDPGLTFDAGFLDYLSATCETVTPLVGSGTCDFLASLGFSTDPADLNLPSIAIGELPGTQTVTRTVTAVRGYKGPHGFYADNDPRQYEAVIEAPPGFDVQVSPSTLYLRNGESASYEVTITSVDAPPGEWRFGSLTWVGEGERDVRTPIAVNAVAIVAPEEIFGAGPEGSASFDITFGYTGDYTAGVHGLNNPGLWYAPVDDDPGNGFEFLGDGTTIAYLAEVPEGTAFARWATFNEYTDGNDDVDLYLYYCPNFRCSFVDSSANVDANEEVSVVLPANNPSITDPYLVFVHGYETDGPSAEVLLFSWTVGLVDDAGNMTVSAPGSATIGATETVTIDWSGLFTGPGGKQLGAISHSDADGLQELTLINITNDPGASICDFGLCPP
jgi:subtilisin family serine protease